jgi:ferric-dicitrate binding protein FerR (iron transport regulator)
MVFREKENKITDIAWEQLCERFEQEGLLPEKSAPENPPWKTAPFTWVAVIVMLVTSGIFSALYMIRQKDFSGKELQVIRNEADAPTLATVLNDGSVVCLSEQTWLRYPGTFDKGRREVILRGDAFFDIRKNAGQPFFIDTESAVIEVTGTSFQVRSRDLLLSVRDGEVRVSLKGRHQTVSVKAGETVAFRSGKLHVSRTGADRFDGYFRRIHFKDERLDNVARIINTTSPGSLRVKIAPEVESRRITFTLSGRHDIEAICLALNLRYQRQDQTVYIYAPDD